MALGKRRIGGARLAGAFALACGVVGLLAGVTEHTWRLGVTGWFTGGILLAILAVLALIDGTIAAQRAEKS